jgi:hypothetical protein
MSTLGKHWELSKKQRKKMSLYGIGKHYHSEETKRKIRETYNKNRDNHNYLKREESPSWKGGRNITKRGYIRILRDINDRRYRQGYEYIFEHRYVMEKYLARYLKNTEIVHHINKNLVDNRIENLILFQNQAEHLGWHKEQRKNAIRTI